MEQFCSKETISRRKNVKALIYKLKKEYEKSFEANSKSQITYAQRSNFRKTTRNLLNAKFSQGFTHETVKNMLIIEQSLPSTVVYFQSILTIIF